MPTFRISIFVLALSMALTPAVAGALALDKSSKVTVVIGTNLSIDLYAKASGDGKPPTNEFYYMPSRVRVSAGPDQEPQLTILTYISDGSGNPSGGTFNALVTWGLTQAEERAVRDQLSRVRSGARLMGAVPLETAAEGPSVNVLAALGGEEQVAWSGVAPLQPGGRAAIAANLSPTGAALLDAGLSEGNLAGITVEMNFLAPFRADLGSCRVEVNWDNANGELATETYSNIKRKYGRRNKKTERRQTERLSLIQWAMDRGHITNSCEYDRANLEQQEFFENAINSFLTAKLAATAAAQRAEEEAAAAPAEEDEGDSEAKDSRLKTGIARYYYTYAKSLFSRQRGKEVFEIDRSFVVREPVPAVIGNVKEWVSGLADHPGVRVESVDLSSTEFTQVPVTFSLGQKAIEMFALQDGAQSQLNTVTVTLRKERERGSAFRDYHVFTKKEVADGAFDRVFEYARGSSTEPFEYEYAVTWSFVGQRPEEGAFRATTSGSHTLEPDVSSARVLFRANPADLEASGILGATAEIKHRFLGNDRTSYLNVFAGDDPQDDAVLFVDNDVRAIAVRTVFTHQSHGELATPWQAKSVPSSGAMPVFAIIPSELKSGDPEAGFLERAQAAVESAAEKKLDDVLKEFGRL